MSALTPEEKRTLVNQIESCRSSSSAASSQYNEPEEAAKNPMVQATTAVRSMLEYLGLYDLMRLRAVCVLWNDLALTILEKRVDQVRIRLTEPEDLERFQKMITRFKLKFTCFKFIDPLFSNPNFKKFFKTPHEEITEMSIMCSVYNTISVSQFRELLLHKLPRLQELELIDLPSSIKEFPALTPQYNFNLQKLEIKTLILHSRILFPYSDMLLTSLYQAVPENLELVVKFNPVPKGSVNFYHQCQTLMLLLPFAHRPGTIICLEFDFLGTPTLKELVKSYAGAQIRSLTAKRACLTDGDQLFTFLEAHASTLEILQLNFAYYEFTMLFPMVMPKLKTLCIFFSKFPFPTVKVTDFRTQFPSLVTFRIRYIDEVNVNSVASLFPKSRLACPTVMELELPEYFNNLIWKECLECLFPNARIVKLMPFPQMNNVCDQSFSDLELESRFNNYFDSRTTGMKGLYEAGLDLYARIQKMQYGMAYMSKLRGRGYHL